MGLPDRMVGIFHKEQNEGRMTSGSYILVSMNSLVKANDKSCPGSQGGTMQLYFLGEKKNGKIHLQMSVEGWCDSLRATVGMISHTLHKQHL